MFCIQSSLFDKGNLFELPSCLNLPSFLTNRLPSIKCNGWIASKCEQCAQCIMIIHIILASYNVIVNCICKLREGDRSLYTKPTCYTMSTIIQSSSIKLCEMKPFNLIDERTPVYLIHSWDKKQKRHWSRGRGHQRR